MENKTINLTILGEVAQVLSKLNETIVFVGGAILSIYGDDLSADEVRPTTDIDLTVKILSMGNWEKFQEELGNLSIYPDPFGHSICSYKYKNIAIDIMPSEDGPYGPANPWYKHGFDQL